MANKKTLFVTFVDSDKRFKAHSSPFTDSDGLVMLTSCLDAEMSRSGNFRGDDDNRPITLPVRMRAG